MGKLVAGEATLLCRRKGVVVLSLAVPKRMPAKAGGASAAVTAFRDVLRHLEHPDVLRDNDLVARFMATREPSGAAAQIRRLLQRMVGELPLRRRIIVQRCDLEGHSHPSVIAALAISRRQFYRDREAALSTLAGALEARLADEPSTCTVRGDALELHLCYADAAHQIGQLPVALQLLRDTSAGTTAPDRRIRLECRLAEYYCEAGMMHEANARVRIAREILSLTRASGAEAAARIDAVAATIAWRSGNDVDGAVRAAERAVSVLRGAQRTRSCAEGAEAAALALLVLGERELTLGNVSSAERQALEANEILTTAGSLRLALASRAATAATTAIMLDPAQLRRAASELEDHYSSAIARGLTLEATLVGLRACNLHRFAGLPQRAAAALEDILPIGRQLLTAEDRAGMCLDLASAYVACGQAAKARHALAEARTHAVPGSYVLTLSYIVEADACLLDRAYGAALHMSEAAADAMRRFDRNQSVVHALRISADARYGLGQEAAAKAIIGAALERLGAAHPFVTAAVHRSAAKITGRRMHRRVAADISNTLCAAVATHKG